MAYSGPTYYQMQSVGAGSAISREESRKQMRQVLVRRNIPRGLWDYYLDIPEDWSFEDVNELGLHRGIETIMLHPLTVTPHWVVGQAMNKFMTLMEKLTTVYQATAKIERFVSEEWPEDNQLSYEYKQAKKRANKLQSDLQLSVLTVIADGCFSDEFYGSISAFIEETRKNEKARTKISDMKECLTSRGVVTHQTNISSDQIKSQLPIFNGETSISILDASNTWESILKNAGIHRQM